DLRRLEVLRKELHRTADRTLRTRRQHVREYGCARTAGREADRCLAARITRVDQCVIDRGALNAAIVNTVAAANARPAVTEEVIGCTDSRSKVVLVARHCRGSLGDRTAVPGDHRVARARQLDTGELDIFPTQAQIHSQPRRDTEIVLNEQVVIPGRQLDARKAQALLEVARIAFADRTRAVYTSRCRCEPVAPVNIVNDEIVDVVVRIRARAAEQVVDIVGYAVDVTAELDRVTAAVDRDGIRKLPSAFVRKLRTIKKVRRTEFETVGDKDARRTGSAQCCRGFARQRIGAELTLKVAAPLESEFIQDRRRDDRLQTAVHRIDAHKVVAPVRTCTRYDRRRLNAVGRIPTHPVIADAKDVAVIDVPVDLREEEDLVTLTGVKTGKRLKEPDRVVDLCIRQTASEQQGTVRCVQKVLVLE